MRSPAVTMGTQGGKKVIFSLEIFPIAFLGFTGSPSLKNASRGVMTVSVFITGTLIISLFSPFVLETSIRLSFSFGVIRRNHKKNIVAKNAFRINIIFFPKYFVCFFGIYIAVFKIGK